jgi:hypothetical protein
MFHFALLCGFSDAPAIRRFYHTKDQAYNALDSSIDFSYGSGHVKLVQGNFRAPYSLAMGPRMAPIQQHGRAFLRIEVRFNEGHVEYRTS